MKKKLIFIFIILAIIGIAVGVTAIINSQTHNKGPISAFGYETTIKSKPTDGTTISDYDSYDNLAIVAGLMADSNFHGETVGEVKAKVAFINYTQAVNNIRTVIDDRAFQEAVSTSSLKSVAIQKYFYLDEEKVLTRNPDRIDGSNTTWLDETPQIYSNKQYLDIYGWLPNQISSYILCKESILEISDVSKREDGYNEISLKLNPEIAPAMYQYEVKAYGGSSDFPSFSNINLTIIFNDDWQLYQIVSEEVYDITMPVIGSITCTANMTETFTYDNLSIKDEDFFEQYSYLEPSDDIINDPSELKPLDYLMYAFGPYLNGNTLSVDLSLNINNNNLDGILFLDLNNEVYGFKSDNIEVIVKNDIVYLTYNSIKLKMSINDFTSILNNSDSSIGSLIDTSVIMDELNDADIVKNNNDVKMTANLTLLGQAITVEFNFTENGENITLNSISANTNINDINISLNGKISNSLFNTNINDNDYEDLANAKFVIEDIKNIVNNKNVSLDINYSNDLLKIEGKVNISFLEKLKLNGNLIINYNDESISLDLTYIDDVLYLDTLGLKLSLTKDKILSLLPQDLNSEFDFNLIINYLFNYDFSNLLNNLNLESNVISFILNLNNNLFNVSIVDSNEGFSISLNDLKINLSTTNDTLIITKPEGSYLDVSNVIYNIPNIIDLFNNDYLNINLSMNIKINSLINLPINLNLNLDLKNKQGQGNVTLNVFGNTLNLELLYKDNNLTVKLGNNIVVKLTLEELLSYFNDLDITNLDLNALLANLTIESNNDNLIISLANMNINELNITNTKVEVKPGSSFEVVEYEANLDKNDIDNIVEYEANLDKNDIDNIINVVTKVIDVVSKDNINIKGSYNNINFDVIIDKELNIEAIIDIAKISLKINYYNNGNIYLTYNNITLKTTLNELIDIIKTYLVDISLDFDLNNLLTNIKTSSNNLTFEILDKEIVINTTDKITVSGLGANLTITNTTNEIAKEEIKGIDLKALLPYLDLVLKYVDNNYLNISLTTTLSYKNNDITLTGNLSLDIANLVLNGTFNINLLGKDLTVNLLYKDNNLTVKLGNNIVVKLTTDELLSYFSKPNIETNNILENVELDNNELLITILGITLRVSYNEDNLIISLADMNINGLNITNTKVEVKPGSSFEVVEYEANLDKNDIDNIY